MKADRSVDQCQNHIIYMCQVLIKKSLKLIKEPFLRFALTTPCASILSKCSAKIEVYSAKRHWLDI